METNNEVTKPKPSNQKAFIVGISCFFALSGFAYVYLNSNSQKEKLKNFSEEDEDLPVHAPPKEEKPVKVRRVERPDPDPVPRKTGKEAYLDDKACPFVGHVINVVDGDTFDADIDLGLQIHTNQRIRIDGINAPELHGSSRVAGEQAKNQLGYIISNKEICIKPVKKEREKFGRILAAVYVVTNDSLSAEVGQQMVDKGFAKSYHGEKR